MIKISKVIICASPLLPPTFRPSFIMANQTYKINIYLFFSYKIIFTIKCIIKFLDAKTNANIFSDNVLCNIAFALIFL